MRVWDIRPSLLCSRHLLGQHREVHCMWSVLVNGKKGYSKHPETLRWKHNLLGLLQVHDATAREMQARGFRHESGLELPVGLSESGEFRQWQSVEVQKELLKSKGCDCKQ